MESAAKSLSSRGRAALAPPPEYLQKSFAARESAYDENLNPGGTVDFSVAENRLSLPLVAEALQKASVSSPCPPGELVYGDMHGRSRLRVALAQLFSEHLVKTPVGPDDLAVSAGAGSVLDLVATCCCETGDRVMVTAPGYKGFENDCMSRAGCELVASHLDAASGFKITVDALQKCWDDAGGEESRIKMVLLSSPNNPTGEILSRDIVIAVAEWTRAKNVHLVMDEIYGMSCYGASSPDEEFVSVMDVLDGDLGDRVHIVWSFSKDFCLSGSRVGVLLSKNKALLTIFMGLTYFSSPAANTQWTMAVMLEDEVWVSEFILENKRRLSEAYTSLCATLDAIGIPFVPAKAGFFVCLDLRKWMLREDADSEYGLWVKLCDAGVLMTPASQMFSSAHGWFRCCFAAVSTAGADTGWRRVREVLVSEKSGKNDSA